MLMKVKPVDVVTWNEAFPNVNNSKLIHTYKEN
jgi:hypothetical protein